MNRRAHFLSVIAGVLALGPTLCQAKLYTYITAENGIVEYDLSRNQGNGWYTEEQTRFKLGFKQADRNSSNPKLVGTLTPSSAESFKGKESLEFYIREYTDPNSRRPGYKVDISSVEPKQAFAPSVTEPKDWFHSFAMKIDPKEYSLPSGKEDHVIFEQWWQGSPFHPPISLVIVNESGAREQNWRDANTLGNFALAVRDDDHDPLGSTGNKVRMFNLGPVQTGRWLHWIVRVRPDPSGVQGAISVSVNGEEKIKLESLAVGYDRSRYPGNIHPSKTMAVDCCLYRVGGKSAQRIFFDEIKFADTLEDVR